jgi:hypothetical protein
MTPWVTTVVASSRLFLFFFFFFPGKLKQFFFLLKLSETQFELSQVAIEKYNQAILKLGETCTNEEVTNSNADAGCTPDNFPIQEKRPRASKHEIKSQMILVTWPESSRISCPERKSRKIINSAENEALADKKCLP